MESSEKKCSVVGRLVKFAVWGIAGLLFLAILLIATLPLWISPVASGVAGKIVPGFTGTDFRLDRFSFNPYSGSLSVSGVKLSNPKGFGETAALSLDSFNMELSVGSLFSDTILVRDVVIDDAFVSYYSHDGKNNFDVILANVEKATSAKGENVGNAEPDKAKEEAASSKKKVIIEHLRVAGTKVKLMKSDMMPPLELPSLELTDIGKKSGGATLEEAWTQIANSVMKSMSSLGDGLGALGGLLGDGAKDISGLIDMGAKGVVGDTAKGTIDAVGDTTKRTAEGVKNLFKGFGK